MFTKNNVSKYAITYDENEKLNIRRIRRGHNQTKNSNLGNLIEECKHKHRQFETENDEL